MQESLLVGAGATIGALSRWVLGIGVGTIAANTGAAYSDIALLLVINILGAGLMGYFKPRPFWGKGVLGGFTSFSAFASAAVAMTAISALMYVFVTVAGCIASFMLASVFREHRSGKQGLHHG